MHPFQRVYLCTLQLAVALLIAHLMSESRVNALAKFFPPGRAPLKPASLIEAQQLSARPRASGELYGVGILARRGLVWRPTWDHENANGDDPDPGMWVCVACNDDKREWKPQLTRGGALSFGRSHRHWCKDHASKVC